MADSLRDSLRREDFHVVRQALLDSGSPTSGAHDGGLHPVAREALDALARLQGAKLGQGYRLRILRSEIKHQGLWLWLHRRLR